MEVGQKIKRLRELNQLTQENMAEKLEMSLSGYTKIERGINHPNIPTLERIARILNVDIIDLLSINEKGQIFIIGDNQTSSQNYFGNHKSHEFFQVQIEQLKSEIQHKNEMIEQKDKEIDLLRQLLAKCQ